MARYIIALVMSLIALAFVGEANAETEVYGGALSYHINKKDNLNNVNPMVFVVHDGWAGGYFYNSYNTNTYFVGKVGKLERDDTPWVLGGIIGVQKGYTESQQPFCIGHDTCAMIMPFVQYKYGNWRPTVVIGFTVVSVAVGYEF